MRRFEFQEGSSNKFWEVSVSANTLTVRFGRIGTAGQEKSKTFPSAALAEKEQDKLVAEKQGKGYKEVGAPSPEKTVAAAPAAKSARRPASKSADDVLAVLQACKPLERVAKKIAALQRPSIRLMGAPSKKPAVGDSKLGGQPDFPAGMEWPLGKIAGQEIHLPFVAQLNLAHLRSFNLWNLLPITGMLYFFYNSYNYGADYFSPESWRVLFHNDANAELAPVPQPKPYHLHLVYNACALKFQNEITVPCIETSYIGGPGNTDAKVELTEEEWNAYADVLNELRANERIHQMLGYADDVQPFALENGYENVRDRFFPGTSPFSTLSDSEKYAEYFQGRLLLQIDDEPSIKMEFGSSGRLFFFIREQDLKARDFTKVWVWEQ
jgi:uncharacterized protein YwqG/predicted DNA-binding WGR domain protein